MAKEYDLWFSFGLSMELDDPEDGGEISRKCKAKLIDIIENYGIISYLEEVKSLEDDNDL